MLITSQYVERLLLSHRFLKVVIVLDPVVNAGNIKRDQDGCKQLFSEKDFFTITAKILARSLANFHCH